jgi:hypothetical protein
MPWMPEVFTAAAVARQLEDRPGDDVVGYYEGLLSEDRSALERSFAGEPRVNDPRVGHVEGTREFRAFVSGTVGWLRERDATAENVALTRTPTRTVEEVMLSLTNDQGRRVELPVAIVADRNPERTLKTIRVYHSIWLLAGEHRVRPPLLPADPDLDLEGIAGDYQRELAEGDVEGVLRTFEPDGYAREPSGEPYLHRGMEGLRGFYKFILAKGGIPLEHCTLTDDGHACAIEYNMIRWGDSEIPAQAGVAVYERGRSGLLSAARIYDDVDPPKTFMEPLEDDEAKRPWWRRFLGG